MFRMIQLLRFIRLPLVEKLFFFTAMFSLVVYRIYLNIYSFQRLLSKVSRKSQTVLAPIQSRISPKRMARLITIASSLVPFSTCLSQALAGHVLFAKYGQATTLHIGVYNKTNTGVEAHAWLCQSGEVILGYLPKMERYRELLAIHEEERI